jgi:hypothetical protein
MSLTTMNAIWAQKTISYNMGKKMDQNFQYSKFLSRLTGGGFNNVKSQVN